ncbi:hypothetical protein [Pseudomonas sp. RTCS2]|uniref:hypothetical protein n=1 Tax=Pseudomonas sp. RTCS2 TaxID=3389877 RepID=UPI0039E639A5
MNHITLAVIATSISTLAFADLPVREEPVKSENFNPKLYLADSCNGSGQKIELGYVATPVNTGYVILLINKKKDNTTTTEFRAYELSPELNRTLIGCSSSMSSSIAWRHQGEYKPTDLRQAYQALVIQHWNNRTWILQNYSCVQDVYVKLSNAKTELVNKYNNKLGKPSFINIPAGTKVTEAWYADVSPLASTCNP